MELWKYTANYYVNFFLLQDWHVCKSILNSLLFTEKNSVKSNISFEKLTALYSDYIITCS